MCEETHKELFIDSLMRCKAAGGFIGTFYDRFLLHEDAAKKFRDTDFEKQSRVLLQSLELIAGATFGDLPALRELRERARTHNRDHLNIDPSLYAAWMEDLVTTAQEHDHQWNDAIAHAWEAILQFAIDRMVRYY